MKYLSILLILVSSPSLAGSEEVSLKTDLGPLSGTLELPEEESAKGVVLMIAGSGPTDRNGNTQGLPGKNNSLKYLSDALVDAGLATLRFDKRLIGRSASSRLQEQDLRFTTYIDDVKLWAAFLSRRFELPIYILGHSEGSLIGIVAAQDLEVAGLISLAGPGRPASEVILEQLRRQLPPALMEESERIIAELLAERTVASTPPELASLFRDSVQPYLISWFGYDPAKEVSKLEIPILLVYGATDIQVPVSDGRLMKSSSPSAKLVVIEGMNHVLKVVDSDTRAQLESYSDPDLPIAEELVDQLLVFLRKES